MNEQSSEAQDLGFETVQIKQSSAFNTGWSCEEIKETKQLKWTQVISPADIQKINQNQFPSIQPTSKIIEAFLIFF